MSDFSIEPKMTSMRLRQTTLTTTGSQHLSAKSLEVEKDSDIKTKNACMEFESLFLNFLLKQMRSTVAKSGLFDGGQAEKIYTSMFDEQLSKELAQRGGIGLAQMLEKSLIENGKNSGPDKGA